jgi:hypothetical protein
MSDPFSPQASSLPTRTGAHRVRRGPLRDALPAVAVLLAVVLIGLGAWALTRSTAVTTSPTSTRSAGTPTSATSSASSPPAGAVDRSTPVTVLNATRTSGLAASVAATLRSSGWQVPTTDNYRRSQPPTTVFYASADQRATASAVADDIGGDPKVAQSSEFGPDRITVVIGPDYAG